MEPLRIAFGSKARSGKDTCGEYLQQTRGGTIVKLATACYSVAGDIQRVASKPVVKDPALLQGVCDLMKRLYGDEIFANILENTLPPGNVYLTDLRHKCEISAMRRLGFVLIRINRPDRPIDRDPTHISEVDLDDFEFDYTITNDGTVDGLIQKLEDIMLKIEKKQAQ